MDEHQHKNPRILFLARWYPHRYDPMFGLFIKKHAEAVRANCEVGVVYVHAVDDWKKDSNFEVDKQVINNVPTIRVYYKSVMSKIPLLNTLSKVCRFYNANRLGIRELKAEMGGFDLIHIHILTRLGLIALYYKWFHGLPFVVSEHWSRYLALTGNFSGFFRKWISRLVVRNAASITTVTKNLAWAMQSHGLTNDNYMVLANVVDTVFFDQEVLANSSLKKKFVHISCFEDRSKNISGLLNVIQLLSKERQDFEFVMIGDGMDYDWLIQKAKDLGISSDILKFKGLMEGRQLSATMATADLTVVFSNYENFPVVINESFVLGIPVIATRVGGIPEYVNSSNGVLIDAGDEAGLLANFNEFLDGKLAFDAKAIQERARSDYNPARIGMELHAIYTEAISAK